MPYKNSEDYKNYMREYRKRTQCDINRYRENPQYYRENGRRHRDRMATWFADYKSTLRCGACGAAASLCFRHRDMSQRKGEVSVMVSSCRSIGSILEEIEKCDVLCVGCLNRGSTHAPSGGPETPPGS